MKVIPYMKVIPIECLIIFVLYFFNVPPFSSVISQQYLKGDAKNNSFFSLSPSGDSIPHPDDPASLVIFQPVNPPQPLLIRSRGSSSASASNPFGSNSVDNNTPTSVGSSGTSVSQSSQGASRMRDDTPKGREMIRREVIRLVIKMSSSVGMKAHEEGLLGQVEIPLLK